MKKTISIAVSICLIFMVISSCHKGNNATSGGSWIFKSTTYNASQAFFILGALTAYTGDNTLPTGSLSFTFYDGVTDTSGHPYTWPPRHTSYIPTNSYPPNPGYVFIQLTDSSAFNSYKISGSTTSRITVDTTTGKIKVTMPPIMFINTNSSYPFIGAATGTDSSLVSASIMQTQ